MSTLRAAQKLVPENAKITIADISKLPFMNQDKEKDGNPEVKKFKDLIRGADAILFACPEYNYGMSGVLKNAIDVASRPYGDNAWKGKSVGIVSASIGLLGGIRGQVQLRQSLVFLETPALTVPECLIGGAGNKFDADGNLKDEDTKKFLKAYVQNLVDFTLRQQVAVQAKL